jgi:hypothetical protein
MWVSLAYASIGWLNCANEHRTISGAIVFAFLTVAALGIRAGSLTAILSIFAFLAFASFACVVSFGLSVAPIALVVAPLLLLGSVRATRFLAVRQTPVAADARLSVFVKKC